MVQIRDDKTGNSIHFGPAHFWPIENEYGRTSPFEQYESEYRTQLVSWRNDGL